MKAISVALLLVLAVVPLASTGCAEETKEAAGEKVEWLSDYGQAVAQAGERDAIIMIDVYTDWCGWCKKLDEEVYTTSPVIDLSRKTVNLKANAEDGGWGQELAGRYGVSGYPAILFIKADGREIDRIGGYLPADSFSQEFQRIYDGIDTYLWFQEQYEAGALDDGGRIALAEAHLQREKVKQAADVAEVFERPDHTGVPFQDRGLLLLGVARFGMEQYGEAINNLMTIYNDFPDSPVRPQTMFYLVISNAFAENKPAAERFLGELKDGYPDQQRMIQQAQQVLDSVFTE